MSSFKPVIELLEVERKKCFDGEDLVNRKLYRKLTSVIDRLKSLEQPKKEKE